MKRRHVTLSFGPGLLFLFFAAVSSVTGCTDAVTGGGSIEDMAGPDMAAPYMGCGLVTCASSNASCGLIGDGCGNTIDCGSCAAPATCGGGGTQFQCGGSNACTPFTSAVACGALNANCGDVADGCGSTISCGTCTGVNTCGGGGTAFQCGTGGGTCTPLTCAMVNTDCGTIGDGCGGTLTCGPLAGACPMGQSCGGGGVAGQCGAPMCTPKTCAMANATCGFVSDGCGGIINYAGGTGPGCGSCTAPMVCGGAGIANSCGLSAPPCVNLCKNQSPTNGVVCPAGVTATITGTVTAPGHAVTASWGAPDPVPGVLVYVPNAAVTAFTPGVSCTQCGTDVSGSPLVSATTATNGTFTLSNVPCGVPVPVVMQLGRWRRQITVPAVACCANTALTNAQTHLPRNKGEGDIPAIAIVSGSADPMECVLPKIGLDTTEFTDPAGTGRVNFYQSSTGGAGATISTNTPKDTALWGSLATMKKYDLIVVDCEGAAYDKSPYYNNMLSYTAAGGRIYLSHFGYSFLHGQRQNPAPPINTDWDATATWVVNQSAPPDQTAFIDQSFPKGVVFANWLKLVSGGTLGQVFVNTVRHDFNAVVPPSQQWMYGKNPGPTFPMHYTFNTPVGAMPAAQCGRVMYSDFHVNTGASGTGTFPGECRLGSRGTALTPQEKVLEYMLFDLTSCVKADVPSCTPKTCAMLGSNCGLQGDGCGGVLNCGTCTAPQTCGAGGSPGVCASGCTAKTCAQLGYNCGTQGDGCGGVLNCGTCTAPATCGGGGPGKCGNGMCTPTSCAALGNPCGQTGNGCGGVLNCTTCTAPATCGGGGMPGICGAPMCTPRTCAGLSATCGTVGDGCGAILNCGTCTSPLTCGGGGVANQCGGIG